jgi:uncharacterized membrane protein
MEESNKGLIIFGIIVIAIGLFASHEAVKHYDEYHERYGYYPVQCPLCAGTVLIVAGIVLVVLGLLYPSWKTLPPPQKDRSIDNSLRATAMHDRWNDLLLLVSGGLLIFGGLLTWSSPLSLTLWGFLKVLILGSMLLICGVILVFLAIERFAFGKDAKKREAITT